MRDDVDVEKLQAFMSEVGKLAEGPGRVYLVGGATALLYGIRPQTIDIDIKLDPEPRAIFEGIALIKERLRVNVELASPDQFIPPIPGWQDRSVFIGLKGQVEFFHYDPYGQALAKIQRGHARDLEDARAFVRLKLIEPSKLSACFEQIRRDLVRYPAVDEEAFERQLQAFLREPHEQA
jgi:hypothetical protein